MQVYMYVFPFFMQVVYGMVHILSPLFHCFVLLNTYGDMMKINPSICIEDYKLLESKNMLYIHSEHLFYQIYSF